MSDLNTSAKIALKDCMNLNSNETFLVVTDDQTLSIGKSLCSSIASKFNVPDC